MTQTTIYDFFNELPKGSKKLVKTDLTTTDRQIIEFLKTNALGEENLITGQDIVNRLCLNNTAQLRKHIKRIRTDFANDIIIGSNSKGYFIPTQSEHNEAIKLMVGRVLSEIETLIHLHPSAALLIHKVSHDIYKSVDKSPQGQMQIKFNGWENDYINRYAEKYKLGEKNDK